MIKNYILEDKSEFKTITIPKGTVLFHGLTLDKKTDHNNIERSNIKELFYNNFGFPNDKGYAIEPKRNVFFYPVPYVALSVEFFNVHIMYLTNYDLELLLMIKPAKLEHESIRDPSIAIKLVESCSELSEEDKCGFEMNSYDPCFSEFCIKNYKNIDGYIAIADTDQQRFLIQYKKIFKNYKDYTKLLHIMPSIAENNAGRIGIPEIVIHPFHRRRDECYYIPGRGYTVEKIIKYSINNQAQYNYFPLLYFTNIGVYHIKDLNIKLLENILDSEIEIKNTLYINTIFTFLHTLLDRFLSPNGVTIKGVKYNLTVDLRTGFYKIIQNDNKNEENIKSNIYIEENNEDIEGSLFNYYSIPIEYSLRNKHKIMGIIGRSHDLYMNYDVRLGKKGMSLKNIYVLDKGDIEKYNRGFYVDSVLERLDLKDKKTTRHHYTRKRSTKKH